MDSFINVFPAKIPCLDTKTTRVGCTASLRVAEAWRQTIHLAEISGEAVMMSGPTQWRVDPAAKQA